MSNTVSPKLFTYSCLLFFSLIRFWFPSLTYAGITTEGQWENSQPEFQGMDRNWLEAADIEIRTNLPMVRSLLVIKDGYIVHEKSFRDKVPEKSELFSITKSITSTVIGAAIQDGKIHSVDDKVISYLPELSVGNQFSGANDLSIRHLLTMTSGFPWDERNLHLLDHRLLNIDRIFSFENPQSVAKAGEKFNYDDANPHLLSLILERVTGLKEADYAKQVLFDAIGIRSFSWQEDGNGHTIGGYGLSLFPQDIAKIGYLYLNKGKWNEKQLVSEDYIADATRVQSSGGFPGNNKYGYFWWIADYDNKNYFYGLGLGGQFLFVDREHNLIAVVTADPNFSLEEAARPKYIFPEYILRAVDTFAEISK